MTETYDPQQRTFIKKPEQKICVTCGQPIAADVKPLSNHMNKYFNVISGKVMILNSNENTFIVQGVTLYKVTGQDSTGKPVSSFAPKAPVAPASKTPDMSSADSKVPVPPTKV